MFLRATATGTISKSGLVRHWLRQQQHQQNALRSKTTTATIARAVGGGGSLSPTGKDVAARRAAAAAGGRPPFGRANRSTATASAPYGQSVERFPSLIIGAGRGGGSGNPKNGIEPVGAFAEAQAMYLDPDPAAVRELADALRRTRTGIVAHYYMDVELQGVLQAAARRLPPGRIGIADSLKMGDMAVEMCRSSSSDPDDRVDHILCLGVDFMSESVQAILNQNGLGRVPVYRADARKIGCSLAESAERESYQAWLRREGEGRNALHVVYINTSLETKAVSNSIVPTITCTSSNVLSTLLQASHQMGPHDLKILYGPDTYMGENLETLLGVVLEHDGGWSDDKIRNELHPHHTRASIRRLRDSISVYPSGNCVVHHMFGASVVDTVKTNPLYRDAYVTAHLEVPGEMFEIAMQKSLTDDGVVGSTSDILKFIGRKVQETADRDATTGNGNDERERLKFILGTEAGMVTSIVQSVQSILERTGKDHIEAEIVFPVSSDAVHAPPEDQQGGMAVVPGVAGGEGCSTAGGCATCPFMKMNHLDAVMDVLEMVGSGAGNDNDNNQKLLQRHLPPDRLSGRLIRGTPALDWGTEPIAYMRHFMRHGALPDDLVARVLRGGGSSSSAAESPR